MIHYLAFFNNSLLRASLKFRLNLFFLTTALTFQFQAYNFIYLFLPTNLLKINSFRFYPNFLFNLLVLSYLFVGLFLTISYYII